MSEARPGPTTRTRVFVSYSHKDRKWLERVKVHLKPLVREGAIDFWDDTHLEPGADWRSAIARELEAARVAILLISADFLASDFIADEEIPRLLRAAEEDGAVILPLIVGASRFTAGPLSRFQAINPPDEPLNGMKKPQREDTLVRLAAAVHRATSSAPQMAAQSRSSHPPSPDTGDAVLLYDSASERAPFSGWILYVSSGVDDHHFRPHGGNSDGTAHWYTMRATGREDVGINKSLPVLSGTVIFEYQVLEPRGGGSHVYFAMIPMQPSQKGLLEVGGQVPEDPANARSPYRLRMFVPGRHYGDGEWHAGRMTFDFHGLPTTEYSIFAPRINEGVDEPGPATLLVGSVRAWGD